MGNEQQLKAVSGYLQAEFPGAAIEDWFDSDCGAHVFRIVVKDSAFQAAISAEFFTRHDASEIPSKLRKFTLAEHLRDLPDDVVLVTNTGLQLQYD